MPTWEHELLGFPVSCHPLHYFAPNTDWRRYVLAAEVRLHYERQVDVCGLIVCECHHTTDRRVMKFLILADYTGFIEVALFAETYRNYDYRTTCPVVAVRGQVDPFDNRKGFSVKASRVMPPQSPRG